MHINGRKRPLESRSQTKLATQPQMCNCGGKRRHADVHDHVVIKPITTIEIQPDSSSLYLICHKESRIEANAKLTNQIVILVTPLIFLLTWPIQ